MPRKFSTMDSLQNLSIHYISYNLIKLSRKQYDELLYLPNGAKNKILRKTLCISSVVETLGYPLYQQIFHKLVNEHTFELNFSNINRMDKSIIKSLRNCQKLQHLTMDGINDISLVENITKTFQEFKHMRVLTITNSTIVQPHLVGVIVEYMESLETLDFRGCSKFNDACAHLMVDKLVKLRRLALSRTAIGIVGVQKVIEGRRELLELMLNGCPKLQCEQTALARMIATHLPQLQILSADVLPLGRDESCNHCHWDKCDVANSACKCTRPLQQLNFTIPF